MPGSIVHSKFVEMMTGSFAGEKKAREVIGKVPNHKGQ